MPSRHNGTGNPRAGSDVESDPAAAGSLVEFLRGERRPTVVFTTYSTHARSVATLLASEFGGGAVATHIVGDQPEHVEEGVDNFKDPGHPCWLLVCDRSAKRDATYSSPTRLSTSICRYPRIA